MSYINKRKLLFILLLFILLIFNFQTSFSYGDELDISSPVESRFYKGTNEQIKKFIEKYEIKINKIISQLHLVQKNTLSNNDKMDLLDALDLLEGVLFQFNKLKRALNIPEYTFTPIPPPGAGPYSLDVFNNYLSLSYNLSLTLQEYQQKSKILFSDLSDLEQQLKDIFPIYMRVKTDGIDMIKRYLLFAQLINLQVEYSLKTLNKKRLDNAIKKLSPMIDECNNIIKHIFNNISINSEDLSKIIEQQKIIIKQEQRKKTDFILKQRRLKKKIMLFEVKLDNLMDKIESPNISEKDKKILKIEKARLEARLDNLKYTMELLVQQDTYLKLNKMYLNFNYNWVDSYLKHKGSKELIFFIRKWNARLKELNEKKSQIKQQINQKRIKLSILNEKMISIKNEMNVEADVEVKKALNRLYNELKELQLPLNKLIDALSNNQEYLDGLIWKIDYIVSLMKGEIGGFARINYIAKQDIEDIWSKVKQVLYYPLWSVSGNVITLLILLRIVFFLSIGIVILKHIRKRLSKFLVDKVGLSEGEVSSISTLIYYFLLIFVFIIALSTAGINLSQLTILIGALGVGIGFGLQTIANNFISGLILLTERTIKVGDIVELENGLLGVVKDISIRNTIIRTYDGLDIIVPNSDFVSTKVTTWTYGDDWRRLRIPFGVSYDSDPEKVAQIAIEVAKEIPTTKEDKDHTITVWFEGFGDSSLNFLLLVWCRMYELKPITGLISDYYFALFRRFKKEGIEMPFPQRDIHIKSVSESVVAGLSKKTRGRSPIA